MADNTLPEGTDKVIAGASTTTSPNRGDSSGQSAGIGSETGGGEDALLTTGAAAAPDALGGTGFGTTDGAGPDTRSTTQQGSGGARVMDRVRSGGEKLSAQAGDKARGLVTQGLERSAEALSGVSRMVGDTAAGIDDRLGAEYGDYARRAASAIENAANNIASKDPDELIEDTRDFVRRSPGVALAGAAIVGFALARLVKSGLAKGEDDAGDHSGGRSA